MPGVAFALVTPVFVRVTAPVPPPDKPGDVVVTDVTPPAAPVAFRIKDPAVVVESMAMLEPATSFKGPVWAVPAPFARDATAGVLKINDPGVVVESIVVLVPPTNFNGPVSGKASPLAKDVTPVLVCAIVHC
jgi:hypothetical protein